MNINTNLVKNMDIKKNIGNQNAAKADTDKAASFIHARCTPADKAGWVHAAQRDGLKLTEWIVKILNTAAKP